MNLGPDEYYHVTLFFKNNQTGQWAGGNSGTYSLFVRLQNLPKADGDRYEWFVQIMRRTSGTDPAGNDWQGDPISPQSETWVFILPR